MAVTINPDTYFGFRRTKGDDSENSGGFGGVPALLVPRLKRHMHFASASDEDTDWAITNPTDPTVYIHSETTPATDYVSVAHDGTTATFTIAGGTYFTFAAGDLVIANTFGLIVGNTAQVSVGAVLSEVEVLGTADADSSVAIVRNSADTSAPTLSFAKSRNATIGSFTIIVTGDILASIDAWGDDGVDFNSNTNAAAEIRFVSSGTIAADRIPAEIRFLTATDAAPSVLTEAMRIANDQNVYILNTNGLVIGNTATVAVGGATSEAEVLGTALADSSLALVRNSADANAPALNFAKSRNATIGSFTIVVTADVLGNIAAYGDDGVDFNSNGNASTEIRFVSSGTIAADRVPGEIQFLTATNAAPSVLTEAMRIANDQNVYVVNDNGLIIGNTATVAVLAVTAELQELGTGSSDSVLALVRNSADTASPGLFFAKSRNATIGSFTIITTGDNLGVIDAIGDDGVDFNANSNPATRIAFVSVGTIAADRIPGEIRFLTATNAAPSVLTERMRIDEAGVLGVGIFTNANVSAAGAGIFAGGIAFTDVANAWIDDATQGTGTTTHFIGNQSITTSSDKRIKDNIVQWAGSAVEFFRQAPRLVEYTYNLLGGGPQDEGYGPNARGRYRGFIAQETIDWAPWIVNAGAGIDCPLCREGLPCPDESHPLWHVQYDHLVPMVVKGVQELDSELESLKAELGHIQGRIAVLEAA